MIKMEKQLFVSRSKALDQSLFEVPSYHDNPILHKPLGGLWTSTYHPIYGSDWVQWCLVNNFDGPEFDCYLLTPKNDLNLLVIDSHEDLVLALRDYGYDDPRFQEAGLHQLSRTLDWLALTKEFDGVHLTNRGNHEVHLSFPIHLNGWDSESTCWLQWSFSEIEQLGIKKFKQHEW